MKSTTSRYADDVPETECRSCPFSCCAHPCQRIFTEDDSNSETYRKLCIKDLSKPEILRVVKDEINSGCYAGDLDGLIKKLSV
jgi:hypothetical protein